MTAIADSDAYFDPGRMLAQHQAALTLLQRLLSDPTVAQVDWLDLASGKGQILANLNRNLNERARAKLHFVGYDIDNAHTRQAERTAREMSMASCVFGIGELSSFQNSEKTVGPWDFITLTNTIHEINPRSLATILINAIERLKHNGCLFVYDMDRLSIPELGAVLWTGPEFVEILTSLCNAIGSSNEYEPAVGVWPHSTCDGWNVQINREHMRLPDDWRTRREGAIDSTVKCIESVLSRKLQQTRDALEALTRCGPETVEESEDKGKLLFDFWAITRALKVQT